MARLLMFFVLGDLGKDTVPFRRSWILRRSWVWRGGRPEINKYSGSIRVRVWIIDRHFLRKLLLFAGTISTFWNRVESAQCRSLRYYATFSCISHSYESFWHYTFPSRTTILLTVYLQ